MAPKFALFTKESNLPLNQGFQNRFLVTTVSRQALEMYCLNHHSFLLTDPCWKEGCTLSKFDAKGSLSVPQIQVCLIKFIIYRREYIQIVMRRSNMTVKILYLTMSNMAPHMVMVCHWNTMRSYRIMMLRHSKCDCWAWFTCQSKL